MQEVVAPQDVKLGLIPQQTDDGKVIVKEVSKGGWAEGVGINVGTRITKLNGLPVQGMSDADLKAALKQRPLKLSFDRDTVEVLLQDPGEKLGCAFAGTPPASTSVSKVAPDSVAERNNVQTGFQLLAVNGKNIGDFTDATFRESLKARPVRLLFQVPKKDEPLIAPPKVPAESSNVFEVLLEDAATKLGCGFAGLPPDAVAVGKVSPGTFAERNKIQTGYLLVALNGIEMKELNPDRFREILKARPVRLRLQIPQSEEKEKIVKEVVKQENAVTALQAIARGQRVRRQWRARAAKAEKEAERSKSALPHAATTGEASKGTTVQVDSGDPAVLSFVVQEEVSSLGLEFDMPPSVVVHKVLEGSWAAGRVPVNSKISSVNGRATTSLDADTLKAELARRPLQLLVTPPGPEANLVSPGGVEAASEVVVAKPSSGDLEKLQKDFEALSEKMQEKERKLLAAEKELAKAKGEVQELRAKLEQVPENKAILQEGGSVRGTSSVTQQELEEVKRKLTSTLQELEVSQGEAAKLHASQLELKKCTQELEEARTELAEAKRSPEARAVPSEAPPQSPDSAASFEITPAYWEHVEIQALQNELSQKDAQLSALRADLAAAYAKLKDGDDKLRVAVPKSVTTLGFRLQKWLVYEVVKGSWADSVGLNLGDRLQLLQQKKVTDWSKEQLKEAWSERPLHLTFRRALKLEKEATASTKIQANWRKKKAKDQVKVKQSSKLATQLATYTVTQADLGFQLELWPPAPKVLVRSVQRNSWAKKAGIKVGDQLVMVQKQPVESFKDRANFRRLWKERPLELTFCPAAREDVERLASSKIQNSWRSRTVETEQQPEAKRLETAFHQAQLGGPVEPTSPLTSITGGKHLELKQLQDELIRKEQELKRLKHDLAQSESTFQKSLANISTESSNSAVEVASLKAQLAVEQAKVAKLQSEGSTKVTSAHAKWVVEQRKAETLETRLVEAEVIHQEQLSEITEYLEARRHELQLEDVDFTKLQPMKAAPNAAQEVERLKMALAEEQERVSSAERKLVKGWSDQRAIDLKWQAEMAAKDESFEAVQKELAKAEWWASISSSPQLKDALKLESELEEERAERKRNEAQASSIKAESSKLQASLHKEEARSLHLQLSLTQAQITDETLRKAAGRLQIPTLAADQDITADDVVRLSLQLQQLQGELQAATAVQGETSKQQVSSPKSPVMPGPKATPGPSLTSRLSQRASVRGRSSLTDDELRTRLASALMAALQDGSLQQHLDKARTVPRNQVQLLRQEVIQLRRQLRMSEAKEPKVKKLPQDSTESRKGALRTKASEPQNTPKVAFEADEDETDSEQSESMASVSITDEKKSWLEEKEQLVSKLQQEKAARLAREKELLAELAQRDHTPSDALASDKAQAELAAELARAKAKIRDYEEESLRKLPQETTVRTDEQKADKAIHLTELAAKDSLLAQANQEVKTLREVHLAEKERWMEEMAERNQELRQVQTEKALPLDVQEEVSEARQLRISMEMQETVAADLRQQLWEAREQLQVAESMGWQSNKALSQEAAPAESAMGQALRQEQELAKHLHEELSEVEMAAITTAEAAEARIIQIEGLDRRGRMALHMAETAAEKEAMLKEDAIKAACEAEAEVEKMLKEMHRLSHEVYEQSQAVYRESAVCDGLRRALMNSVEEEMAQEALQTTLASTEQSPRSRSPVSPVTGPSEAAPPQESASSPEAARARTRGMAFPNLSSGPCANFASRLANREDLKHDLMSPSDVKSWMDPSTISQPSLLSAAAKEAASLRKEAEQLRHEVRHWRASRPLRADPTPPEGPSRTGATSPVAAPQSEASQTARPDSLTKASRKSREAPLNAQVPTLAEQPPPRPPLG